MVTIGTGIGGALIVDGRSYEGARGFHPEMGHHVVDPSGPACYCGATGCWEQLAAGPAIARAWTEILAGRGQSDLRQGTAVTHLTPVLEGDGGRLLCRRARWRR